MELIIYTIISCHLTVLSMTIYLHRDLTHRGLKCHPALAHFFRFWLWITDGVLVKEWVASHRKHHHYTDVDGDPHSPVLEGFPAIFFGAFWITLVHRYGFRGTQAALEFYGSGTPNDWLERNVYSKHYKLGMLLLLVFNLCVFGWFGAVAWLIQISYGVFWTTSYVSGVSHMWGFRSDKTKPSDNSRNFIPWGIFACGEELHNNHHLEPANPRFSHRWFEIDVAWWYITLFRKLGLITLTK